VIERKYAEMLDRLKREPSAATPDPVPGFFARRRRVLPPARQVVDALPSGPVVK
jgi:hypothetical protein